MNDRPNKRSLADDPSFVDSLNDLDRGLGFDDDQDVEIAPPASLPTSRASTPPLPPPARPVSTRPAQPAPGSAPSPGALSEVDQRSSVEDAGFAVGLNDLDRGPDPVDDPPVRPLPRVRSARPETAEPVRPSAPPPPFAAPPGSLRPARRALLDLFPTTLLEAARPPGPIIGSAPGPQLPHVQSVRDTPPRRIAPVIDDLDLRQSVAEPRRILRGLLTVLGLMAFMLLGAGAALWVFRADVARTIIQWERVPPVPGGPIRRLLVPLPSIPPPADVDPSTSAGSR